MDQLFPANVLERILPVLQEIRESRERIAEKPVLRAGHMLVNREDAVDANTAGTETSVLLSNPLLSVDTSPSTNMVETFSGTGYYLDARV